MCKMTRSVPVGLWKVWDWAGSSGPAASPPVCSYTAAQSYAVQEVGLPRLGAQALELDGLWWSYMLNHLLTG